MHAVLRSAFRMPLACFFDHARRAAFISGTLPVATSRSLHKSLSCVARFMLSCLCDNRLGVCSSSSLASPSSSSSPLAPCYINKQSKPDRKWDQSSRKENKNMKKQKRGGEPFCYHCGVTKQKMTSMSRKNKNKREGGQNRK